MNYRMDWIIQKTLLAVIMVSISRTAAKDPYCAPSGGGRLQYTWGDALENTTCLGPNGLQYPTLAINSIVAAYSRSLRKGRSMADPLAVRERLLKAWRMANGEKYKTGAAPPVLFNELIQMDRQGRAVRNKGKSSCSGPPGRLCKTTFNTTAPMYGVSLTSGEPVTIVQKFPDLLQQVIFEACASDDCDVVQGKCTQTYVPYLFLVVPLGPVTLTGQDYVMVESGCVCRPKYSSDP